LDENVIGERVLRCAIEVHKSLGPGLLESVYESCLALELAEADLAYDRQLSLPVKYKDLVVEAGYRLDLLIEGRVIVEVKAIEAIAPVHRAQLLSYLRLGGFRLGYLLNFNVSLMKDGIVRVVNGLSSADSAPSLRPLR
jgi:GxxExxY protein